MKLFTWNLAVLLSTVLAPNQTLADVRPPPGSFDDFAGPDALVGATLLTVVLTLGGLWLARKIRDQK